MNIPKLFSSTFFLLLQFGATAKNNCKNILSLYYNTMNLNDFLMKKERPLYLTAQQDSPKLNEERLGSLIGAIRDDIL